MRIKWQVNHAIAIDGLRPRQAVTVVDRPDNGYRPGSRRNDPGQTDVQRRRLETTARRTIDRPFQTVWRSVVNRAALHVKGQRARNHLRPEK